MIRPILTLLSIISAITVSCAKTTLVDYVNPLVGTAIRGDGGTAPFVGQPFMMTNFLPQTRENKMGSMAYVYDDSEIMGFMASHQPTVWMGDYGYVSIMPQIGNNPRVLPNERKLSFRHDEEIATPYLYSVKLHNGDKVIKASMTAANRTGMIRFEYPKNETQRIIVHGINLNPELSDWANDFQPRLSKLQGWVKIDTAENAVIGYNPDRQSAQIGPDLENFKGYFKIKFNKPIKNYGTWNGDTIYSGNDELYGTRMGAYIEFEPSAQPLIAVIGTSFIDLDQVDINIQKEIANKSFEEICDETKNCWNDKLDKLTVEGVNDETKSVFYTAMYHCYLFPREFSEYGRYYSAFDDKVHTGDDAHNDFSLWDTFRAFHPLMTFLEPERTNSWIRSLTNMYNEGGWMPMWPNPTYTNIMIGTHADAVIADAFAKGLRDYDIELAYQAMRKDAMVPPDCDTKRRYGDRDRWTAYEGRAGASYYHTIGYVPDDKTAESVSRTLEYAYDDWCVAQVAKELGKNDDYERLISWSKNYQNVFNPETSEMLPRDYNGDWHLLDDHDRRGLTEGSKWTYMFCVMHDVDGLIDLMGGKEKFAARLDRNFDEGFYCHDNEPGHHYIYLYDWCDMPWRTQQLARENVTRNYHNAPDGLNGNDDCGQMSAWYLFSSMGFYPVTPGSNMFAIGAPQYPKITMQLLDHTLTIIADNISPENMYVRSVTIDGKPHNSNFFSWDELIKTKIIHFDMTSAHN